MVHDSGVTDHQKTWLNSRVARLLLSGALIIALAACSAPVGVKRLSPRDQHRQLANNALTTDDPSDAAQIVLRRYNLSATYQDQPELALATLRDATSGYGGGGDELLALAELSYRHAEETDSPQYALVSALYAYAFLFPADPAVRPQSIDARTRWAADIYAAGLSRALVGPDGKTLLLQSGTYALPAGGTLTISFDAAQTQWSGRTLTDFVHRGSCCVGQFSMCFRQSCQRWSLLSDVVASGCSRPGPMQTSRLS